MLNKFKNMDPQKKLIVKAVTAIVVVNVVAMAANYVVYKKDQAELDAAE
jgi:hypothetical protein